MVWNVPERPSNTMKIVTMMDVSLGVCFPSVHRPLSRPTKATSFLNMMQMPSVFAVCAVFYRAVTSHTRDEMILKEIWGSLLYCKYFKNSPVDLNKKFCWWHLWYADGVVALLPRFLV